MQNIKLNDMICSDSPKYIGDEFVQKFQISDGFSLMKTNFCFKQPHLVHSSQNIRKMVITICLNGNSTYKNYDGKEIEFKKNYTTITSFDKTDGITLCKSSQLCQLRLILEESFLRRNFSEKLLEEYGYFNPNSLNLLDFSPSHVESFLSINQMLKNPNNDLKSLFLQGKALQLLYNELNKSKQKVFLSAYDKDALMRAKNLLLEDLNTTYTISQIAKKVHLSEVKLKIGFKEFFGTTPYKLLKSQRLNKAKQLLYSGEYNINEVATMIGYKYASNFTLAFTKEFSINPKEILKSVKYY